MPNDRPTTPLTLRLFGPFEVLLDGEPLPRLRSRKGAWILAILALRHRRDVERGWLADTLWPRCGERQALASLRRSLTDLRAALGGHAARLHSPTPHSLQLDLEGAVVDLSAFDEAVAHNHPRALAEAVALYRGPLLEGCTEEWILPDRRTREEAYLAARERLAAQAAAAGDPVAAARHLRSVVAVDPLREDAQRALMQALAASGSHPAALESYRALCVHLHRQWNAVPDPRTVQLFEQIQAEARTAASGWSRRFPPRSALSTPGAPPPPPRHVPRPLTGFVGRRSEVRALAALLADRAGCRLVTLTGVGGVGKSRLAIRLAEEEGAKSRDGAWFVDLASLADPALVPQAIARALAVREIPGRPLITSLAEALATRRLLLVLDNCEHLLAACASLAERLLAGAPELRILATSRRALGITGETNWRVPSLSSDEAMALFLQRAAAVRPDFTLSEENAAAVAEVCHRLDGIPLAIELAAARLRVLSPVQIVARLDDRFALLTGGSRTALPRQQTLRATLDWSYDLLSRPEQQLLQRLSVFAAPFNLAAVEAVWGEESAGPPERSEVLDLLSALADHSLLWAEEQAGEARFRLLETTRAYAREQLEAAAGGAREAVRLRERHAAWFLSLAEAGREHVLNSSDQRESLDRLEAVLDDLRAALEWCLAEQPPRALRLAAALDQLWYMRGYWSEGRRWLERALARSPAPGVARADALLASGLLARKLDDLSIARSLLEQSLALHESLGNAPGVARALSHLAWVVDRQEGPAAARRLHERSLRLREELDDRPGVAASLNAVGATAARQGDTAAATACHSRALAIFRELGLKDGIGWTLEELGETAGATGDLATAGACYRECLAVFLDLGHKDGLRWGLHGLAGLAEQAARREGDVDTLRRAACLYGAVQTLSEALGSTLAALAARRDGEDRLAALRERLDEATFAAAWVEGRLMSVQDAVAEARRLPVRVT